MVSRRRPINQRAGAAFCLDGQSKVHLGDVPAKQNRHVPAIIAQTEARTPVSVIAGAHA
jgi:hypothetical protein